MTKKEKDLLLEDLCARLPYGVKIQLTWWVIDEGIYMDTILEPDHIEMLLNNEIGNTDDTEIKPYLFPLSSMTEEEKEEYYELQQRVIYNSKGVVNEDVKKYINWCYKKHLDINNLIPIGLAIDATGLNIY